MSDPVEIKIPRQIEMGIEEMPSISPVFNKLKSLARDLDTSATDVVKIIMIDPVLSAKVIKLVNSAFYGLKNPIHSLAEAVLFLGINTVKNLAMSTAVLENLLLEKKEISLDPRDFWRHCLGTAVACRMLAKVKGVPTDDLEMYFLGGLLHDLGKVVFIKAAPKIYERALRDATEKPLFETELYRFGCAHTHVGALLGRKWHLDDNLIEAIERHHDPEAIHSSNLILKTVMLGNNLCKQSRLGIAGNDRVEPWVPELTGLLGIEGAFIQLIVEQLPIELQRAAEFLGIAQGGK